MIICVKKRSGATQNLVLSKPQDFLPILKRYPALTSVVTMATSIEEAAYIVVEYLNRHHVDAWMEGEVKKGIARNALVALGLGTATMASVGDVSPTSPPAHEQKMRVNQFGHNHEDAFLWNIKQIESGGGRNVAHRPVKYGIHQGEAAIGKWGLMPKTIRDLTTRLKSLKRTTPEIDKLHEMSSEEMGQYLNDNPQVELTLARFLARHLLQRHHGDERRAAYAWLHGHNLFSQDITDDHLGHDYVRRYEQFNQRNPIRLFKLAVKKSEPAGSFSDKMKDWLKFRAEYDSRLLPDVNFVPDPGRQRCDDLYEKPSGAKLVRDYVDSRTKK